MGPIDYTTNVVNPMASAVQGFQFGSAIQQAQAQRQAQEIAIQQAQAQAERQRLVQSEISALMANQNPTAQDYIRVASYLPEKEAESMRKNWETLSADRQKGELGFASQVLSAANVGKPEIAIGLIRDRAAAEKNAGAADKAKAYETWASILEADPKQGAKTISLLVAQLPGGDKVLTGLKTMGEEERAAAGEKREVAMFPAKMTEQQAKAQSAAVAAKFAESKAVADLKLTAEQTRAIGEDLAIKRQNAAIAAAGVAASREGNAIKRQEALLKLEELKDKRDTTVRERVAEGKDAMLQSDILIDTFDRVLRLASTIDPKTKKRKVSSTLDAAAGPVDSRFPTIQTDVSNLEKMITSIKDLSVMANLGKMKGVLSDSDLKVLANSTGNLDLAQGAEQVLKNIETAHAIAMRARENAQKKYGINDIPITPNATVANTPGGVKTTDEILRELGVTR